MRAIELSYGEMTTFSSGAVMPKQTKTALRKQHGFCLTCPLVPVLVFDIRRSRMNPLWTTTKPRTVEGECLEGKCLKCNPELDPNRGKRPTIKSPPSFHSSRSTQSFASSISSCSTSSLESHNIVSVGLVEQTSVDERSGPTSLSGSQSQSEDHDRLQSIRVPPRHTRSTMMPSRAVEDAGRNRPNRRIKHYTPQKYTVSETTAMGQRGRDAARTERSSNLSARSCSPDGSLSYRSVVGRPHEVPLRPVPSFDDDQLSHTCYMKESEKAPRDLKTMINDVKATGCAEILSEYLLSTMASHHSDEHVQLLCLTHIADEFIEAFDSSAFVAAKGDLCVFDALKSFPNSLDVQEQGCNALGVIATNECNRLELIHRGACSYLVNALSHHLGDASVVLNAFTALRILSTEMEGRDTLQHLSLPETAVEAMQCNISSASIQRDGCAILSNMAVDAVNTQVSAVGHSEISAIVKAMKRHADDESVMASACFALKNFTYNESNLRSMSHADNIFECLERAGKFDSIFISAEQTIEKVYISRAQDESLEEQAHKALKAKVAAQSDDPEIVVVVLESLKVFKWSSRISTACFKILQSLAFTSEPHKHKLLTSINPEQLLSYTEDFRSDEALHTEAAILIDLFKKQRLEA
jgi:hypothetical protein